VRALQALVVVAGLMTRMELDSVDGGGEAGGH